MSASSSRSAAATRDRIVDAASELLVRGGSDAVSTSAVSAAVGVQAPTVYRIFGDRQGLLDTVAMRRYLDYLDSVRPSAGADPVADLRLGWDAHVAYGLSDPHTYSLIYGQPSPGVGSRAVIAAAAVVRELMQRIADVGRLKVSVEDAVLLATAFGCGTVLTLIGTPEDARDTGLSELARETMIAAVTTERTVADEPDAARSAVALAALLSQASGLSPGERMLVQEWLDRIADRAPDRRHAIPTEYRQSDEITAATESRSVSSERHRDRIIAAADRLLRDGGREAVSTRAVSAGANVQAPTIYRIFGDKKGLLHAVATAGYLAYVKSHDDLSPTGEPVDDLRAGWDLHVAFGLANPYLYSLIYGEPEPEEPSPASTAAAAIIESHVHRIAEAGLLRISEPRAVNLVHAAGRGATLTLTAGVLKDRGTMLSHGVREAVISTITSRSRTADASGPAGAAMALRTALPARALTDHESALLGDWLTRIAVENTTTS